jgi:hypothetical protein
MLNIIVEASVYEKLKQNLHTLDAQKPGCLTDTLAIDGVFSSKNPVSAVWTIKIIKPRYLLRIHCRKS